MDDDSNGQPAQKTDQDQVENPILGTRPTVETTINDPSPESTASPFFVSTWRQLKQIYSKRYFRLFLILLVLLALSLSIVGLQQNSKSETLYKQASKDILAEEYSPAASLLSSAANNFSFPATHHKVLSLSAQDKTWILDEAYLNQATKLVNMKSFDTATSLLQKIGKDFPGYQKVLALLKVITTDKQLLAASEQPAKTQAPTNQPSTSQLNVTNQPPNSNEGSAPGTPSSSTPNTIPVYTNYGYNFYYAGARQTVNTAGASVTFPVEQPTVTQSGGSENHSEMELALEDNNYSTVEIGWMVDQPQFGDALPHLFVYHFSNHETTCYDGCGFVQVSSKNLAGGALNTGTVSTFKEVFTNNQWELFYNGDEVGYFPLSAYSDNFTEANIVQVYGEVGTTSSLCIQMGNGVGGNSSGAAAFSNFSLINGSAPPNLSPYQTAPSPYSYGSATSNSVSIGGPGSC